MQTLDVVTDFPRLNLDESAIYREPWNNWEPEKRVFARVIAQAIDDALAPRNCAIWEIESAHQFFYDGRLETFCSMIGWRPDLVRLFYERSRVAVKSGVKWKRLSTIDSVQTPLVKADPEEDTEFDEEDQRADDHGIPSYLRSDREPDDVDLSDRLHPDLSSTEEESLGLLTVDGDIDSPAFMDQLS